MADSSGTSENHLSHSRFFGPRDDKKAIAKFFGRTHSLGTPFVVPSRPTLAASGYASRRGRLSPDCQIVLALSSAPTSSRSSRIPASLLAFPQFLRGQLDALPPSPTVSDSSQNVCPRGMFVRHARRFHNRLSERVDWSLARCTSRRRHCKVTWSKIQESLRVRILLSSHRQV